MSLSNFKHLYIDNHAPKTLVLLHGTGADEYDLLPLTDHFQQPFNILSLRGNINEDGANRFFKRVSLGVFDEANIKQEAYKLSQFMSFFTQKHQISKEDLVFLGYSNGANMILALTFLYPREVCTAVLLHPMLPLNPGDIQLSGKTFIVTYGESDQMITASQSKQVISALKTHQAKVHEIFHPGGHEITPQEISFVSSSLILIQSPYAK